MKSRFFFIFASQSLFRKMKHKNKQNVKIPTIFYFFLFLHGRVINHNRNKKYHVRDQCTHEPIKELCRIYIISPLQ